MYRAYIRKKMEQDRMSCLVISRNLLFLLGNNLTMLLGSDSNLSKCSVYIILSDEFSVVYSCVDSRFIKKVLKIST